MSLDYGMKVSKPGFSVLTATDDQLIFSSKFMPFRRYSHGSGTILHSTGRTHTIYHGLGYVPMFIVHGTVGDANTTNYFQLPYSTDNFTSSSSKCFCWADSTNLYIKVSDDYLWQTHVNNDLGEETSSYGYIRGGCRIERSHPTLGNCDGAMRFTLNVAKNATIYEANLYFYVAERNGSSNMYWRAWGIAEDNTSDFGSDPLGRAVTTHSHRPEGNPSQGSYHQFGIKEAMNDVTTRSGWVSGNNFGVIMRREPEFPDNNGLADYDNSEPYTGFSYLMTLTTDTLLNYKYTIFKDKIE